MSNFNTAALYANAQFAGGWGTLTRTPKGLGPGSEPRLPAR